MFAVILDTLKIEQIYSTVSRAQERVSERASERVSGASEQMSGRASGPLLTSRFQEVVSHCVTHDGEAQDSRIKTRLLPVPRQILH